MKVSIITATYNHEKFIAKCIESVLRQTYPNWEQIIVDDGSTDNTESIVREYAAKDSRIKYIRKEHEGIMNLKNSYNLALDNSTGDLIAILEGDDYWPDYKLEVQVPYFKDENIILTWGKAEEVDAKGNLINIIPPGYYTKLNQKEMKRELFFGNYIPAVSLMIRRFSFDKINGFQQFLNLHCIDHPTILTLIPYGDFKYIPEYILGYWVKHGDNTTISYRENIKPSYDSSYYYYKKLPRSIRTEYAKYDFIMWTKLKKEQYYQQFKLFAKQKFPFITLLIRNLVPKRNISKSYSNNLYKSNSNEKDDSK